MVKRKFRVAGLTRVSRVGDREETLRSPQIQAERITSFCEYHGHELVRIADERDVSGGSMSRVKLEAIVREIEAGRLDGIVVHKLDRFSRSLISGLEAIERIHAAGGFIQTVEGGINTMDSRDNPFGKLQLRLLLMIAEWERDVRSGDLKVAKKRAVSRGVHISGRVPYGYKRNGRGSSLVLDAKKARPLRKAFQMRAEGRGLSEIAAYLDKELPGGPDGKGVWLIQTLRRLFANRVYLGEARQGDDLKKRDAHETLVDERTFSAVAAVESRRERRPTPQTKSLLAGVARCSCCGYMLDRNLPSKKAGGNPVYRCPRKRSVGVCPEPCSVSMPVLDAYIEAALLDEIRDREIVDAPVQVDVDEIHRRLDAARARRSQFANPAYFSLLDPEEAQQGLEEIVAEIAAIEAELAEAIGGPEVEGPDVRAAVEHWAGLSVDERREVIQHAIEAVMVSRAPRGTALDERVVIHWRVDGTAPAPPTRGGSAGRSKVVVGGAASEDVA